MNVPKWQHMPTQFTQCLFRLCVWQSLHLSSSSGAPLALSCCLLCSWGYHSAPLAMRANVQVENKQNQRLWAEAICVMASARNADAWPTKPPFSANCRIPTLPPHGVTSVPFSSRTRRMWAKHCILDCRSQVGMRICDWFISWYTYSQRSATTLKLVTCFNVVTDGVCLCVCDWNNKTC